ncbi:electron transfer flavoprotein subunit beta/FixA family protein [Propionicicella superfundia]|uniref:electron transfer flavoprotein subunit beta/FixA family protein n=1 Tax=Propionicicella superfundia TaxID=348582 RepID=UPI000401CA9D|nr:electron transfer flavoprotein subunit alpha [Propionicicella superfundia]
MTIVVAYKYAANSQDASVAPDGHVDWSRAKEAVSEYDSVAIQFARHAAAAAGGDVVGVTVGGAAAGTPNARKGALARGLDRALVLADDATSGWNATATGSALAHLVERIDGVDCVMTGDASVDEGAQMIPALIAGHLGWPCFLEVRAIDRTADGWRLVQDHQGGTRTVDVAGHVVISVATDAVEAKSPGMKDILAAGKKPSEDVALAEVQPADVTWDVVGRAPAPTQARRRELFDGADAPAELAAALKTTGVL